MNKPHLTYELIYNYSISSATEVHSRELDVQRHGPVQTGTSKNTCLIFIVALLNVRFLIIVVLEIIMARSVSASKIFFKYIII